MKRFNISDKCACCELSDYLHEDDEGTVVLAADAQHEIDARDEKIHDLKALLERAADAISADDKPGFAALMVEEIEKVLS